MKNLYKKIREELSYLNTPTAKIYFFFLVVLFVLAIVGAASALYSVLFLGRTV